MIAFDGPIDSTSFHLLDTSPSPSYHSCFMKEDNDNGDDTLTSESAGCPIIHVSRQSRDASNC
jgi:hypothetical protein